MALEIVRERLDGVWRTVARKEAGGGSSPSKLSDIPGLGLWLDASQLAGLSDGDAVALWPDKSGNGYDAAQANADNQPTYKTAIVNGLPVVRFDPSTHEQFLALAGAGLTLLQGVPGATLLAVGDLNGFANTTGGFWATENGSDDPRLALDAGGGFVIFDDADSVGSSTSFTAPSLPTPYYGVLILWTDGALIGMQIFSAGGLHSLTNGSDFFQDSLATQTAFADTPSDHVWVGKKPDGNLDSPFSGDIAEIGVYPRGLNGRERQVALDILAAKYELA